MVYIHKLLDNLGILPTIILMLQMVKLIQDIYIARDLRLTQKTVKANKDETIVVTGFLHLLPKNLRKKRIKKIFML